MAKKQSLIVLPGLKASLALFNQMLLLANCLFKVADFLLLFFFGHIKAGGRQQILLSFVHFLPKLASALCNVFLSRIWIHKKLKETLDNRNEVEVTSSVLALAH